LEKEPIAGGLCRSAEVDGAPLDIGGGHFLDVKRQEVLSLLFRYLPKSEWNEFKRISTINIRGKEIDYPLEANLWQLPIGDQVEFLESIAQAGCVCKEPMPEAFEDWIIWKFGERIAREYMLPYNRKIWSIDLNQLGTYWLSKLPDVSFRDTLRSCLESRAHGSLPAHGTFLYPKKHGYGEVWKRMGDALGDKLLTSTPVTSIEVRDRIINGRYKAETIITTIPWKVWPDFADFPGEVMREVSKLYHISIDVDYHRETLATQAHWVYEPNENFSYHRILCRYNFLAGARGYWNETNARRSGRMGIWHHRNEHAYPLNTREKPEAMAKILQWSKERSIIGIGRWGTWEHMNSDVAVSRAVFAAKKFVEG
jgi:protoporphyrinogen oxidase